MKMPNYAAKSLKFAVTLLLLFLVFRSVDLAKFGNDLRSFDGKSLVILLLLCWAGQMLCAERWRIFAAALGLNGTYRSFFQVYFAGMFFNIGLPSLVGGDIVKAYVISRKNERPLQHGLASVLQDRAAGLIVLLAYGSLAVLFCPISWRGVPLAYAYLLIWVSIALVLAIVFKGERFYAGFLEPQNRSLLQRLVRTVADFHQSLGYSSPGRGPALRIVLYSIIYAGLVLWIFQQVTVATGHKVGIVAFSVLFPLIAVGTMLPVTLGGLGIREWLYVEALSLVGIPRADGLVISLTTSAVYLAVNLAGIAFLPSIPMKLRPRAIEFTENGGKQNAAEDQIAQQNDIITR
jgi:glycosyltransferase 2 family protein